MRSTHGPICWMDIASLFHRTTNTCTAPSNSHHLTMPPLASLSFGRLCRDGTFSAELSPIGDWTVDCDSKDRQVRLQTREFNLNTADRDTSVLTPASQMAPQDPVAPTPSLPQAFSFLSFLESIDLPSFNFSGSINTPTMYIRHPAHHIIALAASPPTVDRYVVFLEARSPPLLEKRNLLNVGDPTRLTSLDGCKQLPPVLRAICFTFNNRADQQDFLKQCERIHLPHCTKTDMAVVHKDLYCDANLTLLEHLYGRLRVGLAFEAQKSFSHGILDPIELCVSLQEHMLQLQRESEFHAIAIFHKFVNTLDNPTLVQKRNKRRNTRVTQRCLNVPSLSDLLRNAASEYHEQLARQGKIFSPALAMAQSYHLTVTPSSMNLEGPLSDRGNAVLRRFGHHECFLRVTFSDESRSKLNHRAGLGEREAVGERYMNMMVNGFKLAGRKWEFLGYSMSGLKEHSVWFVTPFTADDDPCFLMDAAHIRSLLGDFSKLERKPARLAARWSQAFTATDPSITLESTQVSSIEDRWNTDHSSNFTDGCGTISSLLADEVWAKIRASNRRSSRLPTPSGFQIRLGGAKGVVVQDANLAGKMICLRPSQVKFSAPGSLALDIATTSSRPSPMFLNRPLIVLLEYLGVEAQDIIDLQQQAIRQVEDSRSSLLTGSALLQQHGLGASFRLPSLFANIITVLQLDLVDSDKDTDRTINHELMHECLRSAAAHVLGDIKYRARIPVPGSYTLLGVSDEADCLEENQIYATILDPRTGDRQPILGKVAITRSPQIHPGDIQVVDAVDHPSLHHLTNVVVFSCRGNRSLPSCLGGGDLDGDIYNLILDPKLVPPIAMTPGAYNSLEDKVTEGPCTIRDIAAFVLDYIRSDLLGQISILHLRIADIEDPECQDCLTLAELASQAVDFPKTGAAVTHVSLPRPREKRRPDFLCPEGAVVDLDEKYYISRKVLGRLFRNVPEDIRRPPEDGREKSPTDGHKISRALHSVSFQYLRLPFLTEPSNALKAEMKSILHHYKARLSVIARAHTLSKDFNDSLTEADLVTGTIEGRWGDHRRKKAAVVAMNLQTQELVSTVRHRLRKAHWQRGSLEPESDDDEEGDEDDVVDFSRNTEVMARSWAAWLVAEEELEENPDSFGPQSFGLIALGSLLKIIREAENRKAASPN